MLKKLLSGVAALVFAGAVAFAATNLSLDGNLSVGGTTTLTGAVTQTGAVTPTGGTTVSSGTAPTVFHAGGAFYPSVTSGNDSTAVNTETYIIEVFIPVNTTLTGVSWMGLATSTGNVQFSLATSAGVPIAAAQTASTATAGTANYQTAAFVTPYAAIGPAKYLILMQNSGSNHYRAHTIGNFGASKKTGETYGTFTTVTPPTTFTTNLAPIIDTY
jgi:hypothetical protein